MPVMSDAGNPTRIEPGVVYTLREFIRASGLSYSRIREAARAGIEMKTLRVGRRVFVKGDDAIEFIERLAADTAK